MNITYINGVGVRIGAQEEKFDVDLQAAPAGVTDRIQKLTYKDSDGNDSFVYLTPTTPVSGHTAGA